MFLIKFNCNSFQLNAFDGAFMLFPLNEFHFSLVANKFFLNTNDFPPYTNFSYFNNINI